MGFGLFEVIECLLSDLEPRSKLGLRHPKGLANGTDPAALGWYGVRHFSPQCQLLIDMLHLHVFKEF